MLECVVSMLRFVSRRLWSACACLCLAAGSASALDVAAPRVGAGEVHALGYTGAGVEVGVVDLFLADSGHPAIAPGHRGSVIFVTSAAFESAHATSVAGAAASRDATYGGAAPGAGWWTGQTTNRGSITKVRTQTIAAETFARGLGDLNGDPAEVITLSIALAGNTSAEDQWSLALDHVIHTNGATVTVAAGNDGPGTGTISGRPSGTYNAIIVGATGGTGGSPSEDYDQVAPYSSRGPTSDGRCKPDIVAPGSVMHLPVLGGGWTDSNGTSFATPMVAGGAAVLIDMGRQLGHATDPKVIKSVLLNSAEKLPGWSNTPTRPLDYAQGAGQMDLPAAWRQYRFAAEGTGTVAGIGWDLREIGFGAEQVYLPDVALPTGAVITVTLAWDRVVTADTEDIETAVYSFDHLDNLDLHLYRADDLTTPVRSSQSVLDNVEHLHFPVTDAGQYAIGVEMATGTTGDAETYALAWRVRPGEGLDAPGDANLDSAVNILDLGIVANSYRGTGMTWFHGDFNEDGEVNVLDLGILANHYRWVGSGGGGAPVPEPLTLWLLAVGAAFAARRRRAARGGR